MSNKNRRPILYKGEIYSGSIDKKPFGRSTEPVVSYEEARENILNKITSLNSELNTVPSNLKLPNESIVCVTVQPEYVAKTYYPSGLFGPSNDLKEIGSRIWKKNVNSTDSSDSYGRLFFVRITETGILNLEKKLNRSESSLPDNFKYDIRKVSSLQLLSSDERILGFGDNWESGRIEAVLHPFDLDRSLTLSHFTQLLRSVEADINSINSKQYDEEGLTFISFMGNKKILKALEKYNPLRTAHPLNFRDIPDVVRTVVPGSPILPTYTRKPTIIAGIIDGGYISGNPALDQYVEIVHSVTGNPLVKFQEHGMKSTSAALYGPIHDYGNSDKLAEPDIAIRNFRVLSEDTKDPDLYCVIDAIEEIVPKNSDIQCYNISIGPNGPILDDPISRFTYACDTLSKKHNVLFHVAVGNDGEKPVNYNRIQSPSDIVNGLAVSAYTLSSGNVIPAPYSCKGPGREGNKMKPDVAAMGGCDKFRLQLVSATLNHREYTHGTSFASPQSLALSAKLIGGSKGVISPLTARLLTIHTANENNKNQHCTEMGHGTLPKDVEQVMNCIDKSYTLIYEGELENGTYREYQIPWVKDFKSGKVNLNWTLAVLSSVDPNSPDDYTTSCVTIDFYPNSHKFPFSKENNGKTQVKYVDILKDPHQAATLLADGWKQGKTPKSGNPVKPYASELELRRDYLKWDTIDTRELTMMVTSLKDPVFQIHAMGRGKRTKDNKVKFAVAMTVTVPNGTADIYQRVRAEYQALVPINMDIQNKIEVK